MSEAKLSIWTYDDQDGDFFIAESAEEADAMCKKELGLDVKLEVDEDATWHTWPEDKVFKFSGDDGEGPVEHELPAYFVAKYGKGYLASANF